MTYPLNHKLTAEAVLRLKQLLYEGASQTLVAKEFGLSQPHVSRIASGLLWDYVPWPDGRLGAGDPEILRIKRAPSEPKVVPSEGKAIKRFLTTNSPRNAAREQSNQLESKQPEEETPAEKQPIEIETPQRTRRQPALDLSWMDSIEQLRDSVAPAAEGEILNGLLAAGKRGIAKPSKKPTLEDQKRLPWDHITEMAPTAKMVQLAESATFLIPAIEVVFAKLPRQLWNSAKAEEEVAKVARKFNLIPRDDEALAPIKTLKDD